MTTPDSTLVRQKVAQARALLDEFDIDCWITFVRESAIMGDPCLPFLLGAEVTWHSAFVVSKALGASALVGHYDAPTVLDTGAYDRVESFVKDFDEPFAALMREIEPAQIALNYSVDSDICDGLTHGMFLTMHRLLDDLGMADRIVSAEPLIAALRERKTEPEITAIRAAIRHTEEIFAEVAGFIRPGRTEREIAAFMQEEVRRRGLDFAWPEPWCPAVFTGPNTAGAHYPPSERVVERGHVLNMDFGVVVDGYCSDLQRSFYVLEEGETAPPSEVLHGMDTIVESIARAKVCIKPGALGTAADAASREHVVAGGFEEFPAAVGHQVGRFAHDGFALLGPTWSKYGSKPTRPLEPGMVFTIEPRLSVPDRGVVTVEEMVVVTEDGAEWLSTPQTEIVVLPG